MLEPTTAEHINNWLVEIGAGIKPASIPEEVLDEYAKISKEVLRNQIEKAGRPVEARTNKKLYFSEIGGGCFRKVWYKHHMPDHGKVLMAHERIKFMYGDVTEALILALARASGLEVTDFQKEVEVPLKDGWVLRGKIDARINGVLTDVKSASSRSFTKFKDGSLADNDPFGYLWQLGGYAAGLGDDKAEFLAFDKQLGHLVTYRIPEVPSKEVLVAYANGLVDMIGKDEPAASTRLEPVADGKSGNMKLCSTCSYCAYNDVCWRDANGGEGLRTYLYASGPVSLVHVAVEPKVTRII